MSGYRFARVTGPQRPDGSWPGEAVTPAPDGGWSYCGNVCVLSANGHGAAEGCVYAGRGDSWVVVVRPPPPREFPPVAPEPAPAAQE